MHAIIKTSSLPAPMRAPIARYRRLNKDVSGISVEAILGLGDYLKEQRSRSWSSLTPVRYEAYLRTLALSPKAPAEAKQTAADASKALGHFTSFLEAVGIIQKNPANCVYIMRNGLIRKTKGTCPAIETHVAKYCSRKRDGREIMTFAHRLRRFSAYVTSQGLRQWGQVTSAHVKGYADRQVARIKKENSTNYSDTHRDMFVIHSFLRFLKRTKVTTTNPAEGVFISKACLTQGEVFTPTDIAMRMRKQVESFVSELECSKGTKEKALAALRDLLTICGAEIGLRSWSAMKGKHYETFLRSMWLRWGKSPVIVLSRHEWASAFLAKQLTNSPATGFSISSDGRLAIPTRQNPIKLPGGVLPKEAERHKLNQIPVGFRKDVAMFLEKMVSEGGIGGSRRMLAATRNFANLLFARGHKGWAQATSKDIEMLGIHLAKNYSPTTAQCYFYTVSSFMAHLESRGIRKDDPMIGFTFTPDGELRVPGPVYPRLLKQMDEVIPRAFPSPEEYKARRYFRMALRPLMEKMTKDLIGDWKFVSNTYLKHYSLTFLEEYYGVRQRTEQRVSIRNFCAHFFPDESNPAKNILPLRGEGSTAYRAMLDQGEAIEAFGMNEGNHVETYIGLISKAPSEELVD